MKKAFALFFLSLFLFNVGGYYIVYWGLQKKSERDLLKRLDAEMYSSEDLIVLSIPMSLPYPLQQQGYQRVDNEFEYDGEYYRLVKQRLENDTLFLVCIKDHHQKRLANVLNEYSNYANNLPMSANHTLDLFAKLFKDFTANTCQRISTSTGWCALITFGEIHLSLSGLPQPIESPPPRV